MKRIEGLEAAFDSLRMALWTVLVLGLGVLLGLGLFSWSGRGGRPKSATEVAASNRSVFAPVVERVLPAVVSIDVEKRFRHSDLGLDGDGGADDLDPGFRDREFDVPASGSGFIMDPEGHILTNDHVVRDGVRIDVHFSGGNTLPGRLIGRDPMSDIAVVKVDADKPLPVVPLGNSDAVRIGDWVIAIGNPLGMLEGSVTAGIVSAKGRTDISIRGGGPQYQDFIQTDASINPGNSGGPLVNEAGEAIGVNTAYNAPGNGIGFAISMNMAREVADELIRKGRVPRSMLGVNLMELDPDLAHGWGLDGVQGAVITEVTQGSPADLAGLQEGDVIVQFNGMPVHQVSPLRMLVARTEPGRKVPVRFLRHGRSQEVEVKLTERSDPTPKMMPAPAPTEGDEDLGMAVSEGDENEGVAVDSVLTGGPAFRAGIREGDRILDVGWDEVANPDAFERDVRKALDERGVVVLRIQRGDVRTFLTVRTR